MTMKTFSHLAEDGDFILWPLNCLGLTILGVASYEVLNYYKTFDYRYSYCFYDNYYYLCYYPIMACYALAMIFVRTTKLLHFKNRFWSIHKTVIYWIFFIETEGLLEFVYSSRKIEYMVEDPDSQMMIYLLMVMGIFRWSLVMLSCYLYSNYLDSLADQYQVKRIRFGWLSQILADYAALHYFLFCLIRTVRNNSHTVPSSLTLGLAVNNVTHSQWTLIGALLSNLVDGVTLLILVYFYLRYVRKEITLFNFAF